MRRRHSAYGTDEAPCRGCGGRARMGRPHVVAVPPDVAQLLRTMLRSARSATRSRSSTTSRVADLTSATSPRRRRRASACRTASTTRGRGDCTWPTSRRRSSRTRASTRRVRRITTADFGVRAHDPPTRCSAAREALRSCPHWREGLRACLARLDMSGTVPRQTRLGSGGGYLCVCAFCFTGGRASSAAVRPAPRLAGRAGHRARQADLCRQPRESRGPSSTTRRRRHR